MFVIVPKPSDEIRSALGDRKHVVAVKCYGCMEVYASEERIDECVEALDISSVHRWNYLCREEFCREFAARVADGDAVVVFSCGVGIQTMAGVMDVPVIAGCDTFRVPGFQGLHVQDVDCKGCAQCFLNDTAGICPVTACAKGLLNGPCGGAKNGKCEVDDAVDCAWLRILERKGGEDVAEGEVAVLDYRRFVDAVAQGSK